MASHTRPRNLCARRRGIIAVQVGVLLVVMLGFAALTVDLGTLYNTRGDVQRTADAAALAGASAYTDDAMMQIRTGTGSAGTINYVTGLASSRVGEFSSLNPTFGKSTTTVDAADIQTGWVDLYSATSPINTNPLPTDFNAVQVTVRREAASANGPVQFFFAPIFGRMTGDTSASAVAVFDDRVGSFSVPNATNNILPFTIDEDIYWENFYYGPDDYAYNNGTVSSGRDNIPEIRLFPYSLSGSQDPDGAGNYGTLNIGSGDQGLAAEEVQILNGVSASDFEAEIGTSDLDLAFGDAEGSTNYTMTGSPGLEAGLKSSVSQLIGEVVGFFLHDSYVGTGSNLQYRITSLQFGRVMDVRLTGPPNQRGLFLQPVAYVGGGVTIDPDAPSTGGLVGRIVLAR